MKSFDLGTLGNRNWTSYFDNNIAILKHISELKDIPSTSVILEGMLFAVVTKGNAEIQVDNKIYTPRTNDLFVCEPQHLLCQTMISMDFEAIIIIVNPDYAEEILKKVKIDWQLLRRRLITPHELIHLEEHETMRFSLYVQLIELKLGSGKSPNQQKSIDLLICALAYEFSDVATKAIDDDLPPIAPSKGNIIDKFYKMLHDDSQPFCNVNGYADRLHISAKYFSSVCKHATGKTASQLINEQIIRTAKLLLHDNDYSIKQIADRLGFANQSHFGAFFNRHAGCSPQQYRQKR